MPQPERVRFGVFDFDPATRELRRQGVPVRLQAHPAQVLTLLVEHAGEMVSREALRRELWGETTFVDFDRNINFCIAQIRTALGDSADSPRFIRTLPKRGYQFIAPVSRPSAPDPAPPAERRGSARRRLCAASFVLVLGGVGVSIWLLGPTGTKPAAAVAVVRFDNETDDPAFTGLADTLTDSVVGELAAAGDGRFGVIGNAAILRAPRQGRDLLAIGSVLHAGYVVIGQVQRDGAGIRILAHLIRLPDQKHVWVVRADSTPQQAVDSQSTMARRIAREFSSHLEADHERRVLASSQPITH
ncbi:MAG TPA: winged helix-turn-helix domain-containing protein [Bryobacteraceae bacterium]|nr:winged helix-turn-helix domain-containing protein [Bryobacteraceae bacterium]